jgi:hypothetical protein
MLRVSVVQPQYGPTLLALLRPRSLRVRLAAGALVVLLAIAVVVVAIRSAPDETVVLIHKPITFNFAYGPLMRRTSEPGALVALERRRGDVFLESFAVRDLRLPAYTGAVGGMLPLWSDGYMKRLEKAHPDYRFVAEGRTRINNGVGYSIAYRGSVDGRALFVRHFLIVPEFPDGQRHGVVLELRTTYAAGTSNATDVGLHGQVKMPLRSFRFGEDREGGTS